MATGVHSTTVVIHMSNSYFEMREGRSDGVGRTITLTAVCGREGPLTQICIAKGCTTEFISTLLTDRQVDELIHQLQMRKYVDATL